MEKVSDRLSRGESPPTDPDNILLVLFLLSSQWWGPEVTPNCHHLCILTNKGISDHLATQLFYSIG